MSALSYARLESTLSGHALATMYADLFSQMEEAGAPPDAAQVRQADAELAPHGLSLDRDDAGGWAVVRSRVVRFSRRPMRYVRMGAVWTYAAVRCPAGGMSIAGKAYRGGQFVPGKEVAKASPAEKARLEETQKSSAAKAQVRADARKARGPVDKGALLERLGPHAPDLSATTDDAKVRARAAWRMLKQHHGEHALHRVEELAGMAHAALGRVEGDSPRAGNLRGRLGETLAKLQYIASELHTDAPEGAGPARLPAGGGSTPPASAAKQPWEMGGDEFADANAGKFDTRSPVMDREKARKQHARLVADRILGGGDVPPERLKEYPFLDVDDMSAMTKDVVGKMGLQNEAKAGMREAGKRRRALIEKAEAEEGEARKRHDAEAVTETLPEYLDKQNLSEGTKEKILRSPQGAFGLRTDPATGSTVESAGGSGWYMPHYDAVKSALAAGKPVSPEVLADYPGLSAKYPEAAKFTGIAANGVRFVDGVAQKAAEDPAVAKGEETPAPPASEADRLSAVADLRDPVDRAVLSDAMEEAGRDAEASALRAPRLAPAAHMTPLSHWLAEPHAPVGDPEKAHVHKATRMQGGGYLVDITHGGVTDYDNSARGARTPAEAEAMAVAAWKKRQTPERRHRSEVREAIGRRAHVPAEVLADYPDLAKEYRTGSHVLPETDANRIPGTSLRLKAPAATPKGVRKKGPGRYVVDIGDDTRRGFVGEGSVIDIGGVPHVVTSYSSPGKKFTDAHGERGWSSNVQDVTARPLTPEESAMWRGPTAGPPAPPPARPAPTPAPQDAASAAVARARAENTPEARAAALDAVEAAQKAQREAETARAEALKTPGVPTPQEDAAARRLGFFRNHFDTTRKDGTVIPANAGYTRKHSITGAYDTFTADEVRAKVAAAGGATPTAKTYHDLADRAKKAGDPHSEAIYRRQAKEAESALADATATADNPQAGFTGIAANGVRFVDGVAQKAADSPRLGFAQLSSGEPQ